MRVMDGAEMLVIGRFGRLTGLSVGALRHYDELGILRPARVDPETGYRSYRRDQVDIGRTIVRLRDLEVPLDAIRSYLDASDPEVRRLLLADHRDRIEATTNRYQRILHVLTQAVTGPIPPDPTGTETKEHAMTSATLTTIDDLDGPAHRTLGTALFNHVWTLLERPDRTPAQVDELIHAAHASRFHWSRADDPEPTNLARGEWQCSRVYAVLGRAEPALWHARRCLAINDANGRGDWDIAAAYQAMARASGVAGDPVAAADWKAKATAALDGIADRDDRDVIEGDIATLP
jgi:DNA-binding transcriptional MerR regulator